MSTPSARESKWPQVRQDVHVLNASMTKAKSKDAASETPAMNKKSFQAAQAALPTEISDLLKDTSLVNSYKKAGVESNQRASAATAWLLQHAPGNHWQLSHMAWAGS